MRVVHLLYKFHIAHWLLGMGAVFVSSFMMNAQTVTITGEVTDEHTEEPLGYANVYVKGTTIGVSTNMEGKYKLQVPASRDSLVASVVGYDKKIKLIDEQAHQTINFELKRSGFKMSEVVVRASNKKPAHIILDEIIKNKSQNNRSNLGAYQYEVYNKIEVDVDNIQDAKFTKKKMFQPFQFVLNNIDTVSGKEPFLPVFLSETLSDYYYRKTPTAEKEFIKATRLSGVKNATITNFLGSMYQEINIYKDFIPILDKSFVSPIAEQGRNYYNYKMIDTAIIEGRICYKINFKPKRKQTNTFFGYFWVVDNQFAIQEISMQMAPDVNINFVERLSVFQEFKPVKDLNLPKNIRQADSNKVWMLEKDKLVVDFVSSMKALGLPGKKSDRSIGVIGRKTTSYSDVKVNPPNIDSNFNKSEEEVVVADSVYGKKESYWRKVRHDTLSKNEQAIYSMVDTLKDLPEFQTVVDVVTTIVSGYKEAGKVDIGPYFSMLSTDQVEGLRVRFGVKTNDKFSERLLLKGYVAFGTKDRDYKYGVGAEYVLSREPWQKVGVSYKDDLNLEAEHFDELDEDNLFAIALRKNVDQKLIRVEERRAYYERQLNKSLSSRITLRNAHMDPYFPFEYRRGETQHSTIKTTESRFNLRFAYKEKFVKGGFNRVSIGTDYPVVEFNYTVGVSDVLSSDFNYHKLSLNIEDDLDIKPKGKLSWALEGGKVYNKLPYLLLKVPKGNDTYYYNRYAFNNMGEYHFAADQYAQLFLTHYFEGLLLDRVPRIRRLKWRTLVTGRAFWGKMNTENQQFNQNMNITTAYPLPYVEVGGGIENIFRFFRVDAVWRLTHPGTPTADINRFNVYGSLQLKF